MSIWSLFNFIGGVGLFLLGMKLMTEGLKVAAGDALRRILNFATRSRWRGLASGALITGVVQSSSAVIFATIGFVNAGILGLSQAVGVIYGANLGTTVTTWLVSVVGLGFSLKAFALPFIGLGMMLRILARTGQLRALGDAIAGFGVFFLGLDVLTDLFRDAGPMFTPSGDAPGLLMLLLHVLAGFVMTVVMQSSSAALAVILTAAAGGLLGLPGAAAMVVGANLGTTSTAVFAALGATANAQRVAASHVIFNVVEALAIFLLFGLLLAWVQWFSQQLGMAHSIAVALAVFHTTGKLIGLMVMWPLTRFMVDWLERRFRQGGGDLSRPQFLDQAVLITPSLGLEALHRELDRAILEASHLLTDAIGRRRVDPGRLSRKRDDLVLLLEAINEATQTLSRNELSKDQAQRLPDVLRTTRYLEELAERTVELDEMARRLPAQCPQDNADTPSGLSHMAREISRERDPAPERMGAFETAYQRLKSEMLFAGASGQMSSRQMSDWLDYFSTLRRAVKVMLRAVQHASQVGGESDHPAEHSTEHQDAG